MWLPHVTVAAIIEQDGRFLMVEERDAGRPAFNQPAGHLEDRESLLEAVIREVREETTRSFTPEYISGVYQWRHPNTTKTYLRFCFYGQCGAHDPQLTLDPDIVTTHWLTFDEIRSRASSLRSPLVIRCVDDYLSGQRLALNLVNTL